MRLEGVVMDKYRGLLFVDGGGSFSELELLGTTLFRTA